MAIGFLEVAGYGTAIYAMDKVCKEVDVRILGIDTINPKDTSAHIPLTVQVKFEGEISEVEHGLQVGKKFALKFNSEHEVVTSVIKNPYREINSLGKISKVKLKTP